MKKGYWYFIIEAVILLLLVLGYMYYSQKTTYLHSGEKPIFSFTTHQDMDHSRHENMAHGDMITGEESFLKLMIPHHQEAIDTSKILLQKTSSAEIKTLLENIISAQQTEVQIMSQTMQNLYNNETAFVYENMMDPNLENLEEKFAEISYLRGMIVHHKGAIEMAQKMQNFPMESSTRKIVENILSSQQEEIDFMKTLLENY